MGTQKRKEPGALSMNEAYPRILLVPRPPFLYTRVTRPAILAAVAATPPRNPSGRALRQGSGMSKAGAGGKLHEPLIIPGHRLMGKRGIGPNR